MNEKNIGVLVDTSVWIEFFKQHSETGDKLSELIIKNVVWTCGIVLFEIIQGVKTEDEKATLLETLLILPYVEMTQPLWQKAGELSATLKKKGVNLPLSDIFIATICLEHKLSIFTLDKHFEQIPGVRIYKM
ncbi:MAG TPA: PIN domain-containing protein [Thermodesulfovibrionales bacterium]|nr:PIN domain-containing protein [Thermodesulfovibrionales bacterium]